MLREFVEVYGPKDGVDTRGALKAIHELERRLAVKS
jgi:hypothetical protein